MPIILDDIMVDPADRETILTVSKHVYFFLRAGGNLTFHYEIDVLCKHTTLAGFLHRVDWYFQTDPNYPISHIEVKIKMTNCPPQLFLLTSRYSTLQYEVCSKECVFELGRNKN